jgi:prepilin-type N-terminal cleavage/methylation domain-containing protein
VYEIQGRDMKKNGFTLIELLVVMIILVILLAIVGLSMRNWLGKARVEEEVKQMYADFLTARTQAMNYNRMQFVQINLPNQYRIWDDRNPGPDGNGTLEPLVPASIPGAQPGGDWLALQVNTNDALSLSPGGLAQFSFDTKGLISQSGSIRITNTFGAATDCIVLSATRIRLGRWDGVANCVSQ